MATYIGNKFGKDDHDKLVRVARFNSIPRITQLERP